MVFNGRISSFLAVIDPNSFGLVFFIKVDNETNTLLANMRNEIAAFEIDPILLPYSEVLYAICSGKDKARTFSLMSITLNYEDNEGMLKP